MIHIIGLGISSPAELNAGAQSALLKANIVIGSERQLALVEHLLNGQRKQTLPALSELKNRIDTLFEVEEKNVDIAVLASGDPLFYGIGSWFNKNYNKEQLSFYPAISSIQTACHELGLSLQDVEVLSLHGRPTEKIRSKLKINRYYVILTDQHSQPQTLAQECINAGFNESKLWICENMGYDNQQIRSYTAKELNKNENVFDPLHVTVIQTAGEGGLLSEFPGIADTSFVTDGEPGKGMLTKREVRLTTLTLLQPSTGDVIWDIGAGCGGVSIELAYWNEATHVYSIEHHQQRLDCLQANQSRFGVVNNLHIISGRALDVIDELPAPNKIFIGGSGGDLEKILELSWQRLPSKGVLLASSVTEQTKQGLINYSESCTGEMETLTIAIDKGVYSGGQLEYQTKLPVTLFKFIKP